MLAAVWTLRALYRVALSLAVLPWAISLDLEPDIRVACDVDAGVTNPVHREIECA